MKAQPIDFHYQVDPFHFVNRQHLKRFIAQLIKKEGQTIEHINYIFCSDPYLLEINRQYLNHDTYTDIITFQLSPPRDPILADVYISIPRVKENAQRFETSFTKELYRVIFHGALHLCGYKDKKPGDAKLMRTMEDHYLDKYY